VKTRTLLHLPYQVARTPLALVDATLAKRLPVDSPPRLAFERILGSLDEVAGRLLKDKSVQRRGSRLRARAETLGDAVQLEQDAAERRRAAAEAVQEAERHASRLREDAQRDQSRGVQEAAETEGKAKQAATRRARAQANTAKQRVDARAAAELDAVERKRKLAEARANARKRRASAEAKADLDAAAEKKAAAGVRRSEAAQLAKLTQAKQQARTS